jgi:BirA family biotin operon repressor/biotin-[acetyl-CoA-carboxylase] ligase
LAESTFDRDAFARALTTRRMGRRLIARARVESTNDVAWDALAEGMPDGTAVVADEQTRGRGRAGRSWWMTPGRALAISLALHPGCDAREMGTLPLVAGLALAEALESLGARPRLKWPNDVLIGERKLGGILCESRRRGGAGDAVVVGVGVNVSQSASEFPAELAGTATSLGIEGVRATRERVAAALLNRLEPLWDEHAEGGRGAVLERWRARADFWGREVTVRTPSGALSGIARRLDSDGGLVISLPGGGETTALAGDLELGAAETRDA